MLYLRVELNRINLALRIFHSGYRTVLCVGNDLETLRSFCNVVSVGHPHDGAV